MSRGSDARRQRRALAKAGVEFMDRVSIDSGALAAAVANGANLVDLVSYHVAEALGRLDEQGADIIGGTTAVTIGQHPDFPGGVTIEAKAGKRKTAADPDPGCLIDHSLDMLDEDEPPLGRNGDGS